MIFSRSNINHVEIITGENYYIKFEIAPTLGGKILSIYNKHLSKEFLWRNKSLLPQIHQPGADYDANFSGGIDELIPNDIPETIDCNSYPDHGELWTTALSHEIDDNKISVFGTLPLSLLYYKKTVYIDPDSPTIHLEYLIQNNSGSVKHFLWKLHAALAIEKGDKLITHAKKAKVVDPYYSRFKDLHEFQWPFIENTDASIIPKKKSAIDFFYLYQISKAEMSLSSGENDQLFRYSYDGKVFPFQWYFASYGGFNDHYTAILEPSSAMPISVNEAIQLKQCSVLEPGEQLSSTVRIYAGENI